MMVCVTYFWFRSVGIRYSGAWLVLLVMGASNSFGVIFAVERHIFTKDENNYSIAKNTFSVIGTAFISLVLVTVYITTVGPDIFGSFPSHLGGGQFRTARLLIRGSPSTFEMLEMSGLQFVPRSEPNRSEPAEQVTAKNDEYDRRTEPVSVVVITDTEYFVRSNNVTT